MERNSAHVSRTLDLPDDWLPTYYARSIQALRLTRMSIKYTPQQAEACPALHLLKSNYNLFPEITEKSNCVPRLLNVSCSLFTSLMSSWSILGVLGRLGNKVWKGACLLSYALRTIPSTRTFGKMCLSVFSFKLSHFMVMSRLPLRLFLISYLKSYTHIQRRAFLRSNFFEGARYIFFFFSSFNPTRRWSQIISRSYIHSYFLTRTSRGEIAQLGWRALLDELFIPWR